MKKTRFGFPLLLICAFFVVGCSETNAFKDLPKFSLEKTEINAIPFSISMGITEVSDDIAYEVGHNYGDDQESTDLYVHFGGDVKKITLADNMRTTSSAYEDDNGFWLAYGGEDATLVTYIELPSTTQTIRTVLADYGSVRLFPYGDRLVALTLVSQVVSLFAIDQVGQADLQDSIHLDSDLPYFACHGYEGQSVQFGTTLYMSLFGHLFSFDGLSLEDLDESGVLAFVPEATTLSYWKESYSEENGYALSRVSAGNDPATLFTADSSLMKSANTAQRAFVTDNALYLIIVNKHGTLWAHDKVYILKVLASSSEVSAYDTGTYSPEVYRYGGYLYQDSNRCYRYTIS